MQLPNELLTQMLEELWDDVGTLMSCVGTCSRMRELTHRVLYAAFTIDLNRSDSVNRARLRCIRGVLPLAVPHMRALRIDLGPMDIRTHRLTRSLFRWISNSEEVKLKELYLRGHLERLPGGIVASLLMLPSIQLLSLIECANIPVTVFQHRPALRSLIIRYSSISAPFEFSDFYSTAAIYGFAKGAPLDDNAISFPESLDLSLGLSDNPEGDCLLLHRCGAHLTTLSLFFDSIIPESYLTLTGISSDSFPVLSSLSMLFNVADDMTAPIDVVAFIHGISRKPSIRDLRVGFNFECLFFDNLLDQVPSLMTCPAPFDIAQVFDRRMLPHLETGCCILRLSIYNLHKSDQEEVNAFLNRTKKEFSSFFPRPSGFEWVNLAVEISEASEDDIDTSS